MPQARVGERKGSRSSASQRATPAKPTLRWAATPDCDLLSPQPAPGCHGEATAIDPYMPRTESKEAQMAKQKTRPRSHSRHRSLDFQFSPEETLLTADGASERVFQHLPAPGPELGHPLLHSPLCPLPNRAILGPSHGGADLSIFRYRSR